MNPELPEEYIDSYEVVAMIGEGGQAKVYLCIRHQMLYAVKVFHSSKIINEYYRKEVKFLSDMKHENIIKIIDHKIDAKVKLNGEKECIRSIIVLQYVENGELYEYVKDIGGLSEEICRFLIKKVLHVVEYVHSKGITHRDLKLENILFDQSFKMKLTDFGLSTNIEGNQGNGILRSRVGTEGFRPPQMEKGKYSGIQSDIFALGVILFIIYTGNPPFLSATCSDKIYKRIKMRRFDSFWMFHESLKNKKVFPASFKNLMNSLFDQNPEKRLSLEKLKQHEWINGDQASESQVKEELFKRFETIIDKNIKDERMNILQVIQNIKGTKFQNFYQKVENFQNQQTTCQVRLS